MDEFERIEAATHEEVIPGDFVHLRSGSPLGLVSEIVDGKAVVTWLTLPPQYSRLLWLCLRPIRPQHA